MKTYVKDKNTVTKVAEPGEVFPMGAMVIPSPWLQKLKMPSGKPDLLGATLLAVILDKFGAIYLDVHLEHFTLLFDKLDNTELHVTHAQLAEAVHTTKRHVIERMHDLEDQGLLHMNFRTIGSHPNEMFVSINKDQLKKLTEEGGS